LGLLLAPAVSPSVGRSVRVSTPKPPPLASVSGVHGRQPRHCTGQVALASPLPCNTPHTPLHAAPQYRSGRGLVYLASYHPQPAVNDSPSGAHIRLAPVCGSSQPQMPTHCLQSSRLHSKRHSRICPQPPHASQTCPWPPRASQTWPWPSHAWQTCPCPPRTWPQHFRQTCPWPPRAWQTCPWPPHAWQAARSQPDAMLTVPLYWRLFIYDALPALSGSTLGPTFLGFAQQARAMMTALLSNPARLEGC
jgi:hypothetical protein